MLKTRKCGIFILLVMLCITLACFVGCGNIEAPSVTPGGTVVPPGPGPGPVEDDPPDITNRPKLSAVDTASVTFTETSSTLVVEWPAVSNATMYSLRITVGESTSGFSTTIEETSVDLRTLKGLTVPNNGSINIRFTAKASGYTDSEDVTITYELEGTLLLSPEITSFNNGVIEWKKDADASSYTVKVNGKATETQNNTYNVNSLSGKSTIEISAKINGKTGAVTSVMYDADTKKLCVLPITDFTLDGDILKWGEVGGAVGYKIVDLDFNAYTVTTPHYIMAIRNIIYGVYPVMPAGSVVESAEIEPTDIKYLEGAGTEADPYLIKTPFDLRTIDYYELRAADNGGKKKNYYRIENDINYNTVSALEADSNMYTLRKPFFGTLDGNGKTLSNISVHYNNGFWALFEFIAKGGTVKNVKFDNVEINNSVQDLIHPTNPETAMVAYRNYGTVSGVTLSNATLNITAGSAAGLVVHNYGTVSDCTVNKCNLKENATRDLGAAAYEMAGVVLENLKGGTVSGNKVNTLNISGASSATAGRNIGSSAGIVAINRAGGTVKDNSFDGVTVKNVNIAGKKEVGGVVGYCANGGTVTKGTGTLGTLTVDSSSISVEKGSASTPYGKLCGKQD